MFAVSESLRQVALSLGIAAERVRVVGNGVDLHKFSPLPRAEARRALQLDVDVPVLVTVGALVERKGAHRVIALLPALRRRFPGLTYLVVGGASPEGDMSAQLRQQVRSLGLDDAVRFLGPLPVEQLRVPLSAADLFVLATRNEGWANVLLEAMACGLPIVATDVGGNAEVVCEPTLGTIVPFGDAARLQAAIEHALGASWDIAKVRDHAARNSWDQPVRVGLARLEEAEQRPRAGHEQGGPAGVGMVLGGHADGDGHGGRARTPGTGACLGVILSEAKEPKPAARPLRFAQGDSL